MKTLPLYESNHTNVVIPRDFFNYAKLLKCMGFLALNIHNGTLPDGIEISIEESGEQFEIGLEDDLFVVNKFKR